MGMYVLVRIDHYSHIFFKDLFTKHLDLFTKVFSATVDCHKEVEMFKVGKNLANGQV